HSRQPRPVLQSRDFRPPAAVRRDGRRAPHSRRGDRLGPGAQGGIHGRGGQQDRVEAGHPRRLLAGAARHHRRPAAVRPRRGERPREPVRAARRGGLARGGRDQGAAGSDRSRVAMRLSHFFIDRPIFAAVLSIILTIAGAIVQRALPVSEYPDIVPPTVNIRAVYPGASAQVLAETVATPIEQEVNGVDNMLYIVSQSTGDGVLSINVVFKPGTNIDTDQVLVQNRVAVAQPRLPDSVQRLGVTVRKASPDLMMVVHMISRDGSRDQQYISNYATLYIKDRLAPLDGVGDVRVFGPRDYPMRVWLDPGKVAARGLTATDVVNAIRAANLQVAAGAINQPPAHAPGAFQLSVQTLGRLADVEQFGNIVIRSDPGGTGYVRVRDVARVELGSQDYTVNAYLDHDTATALIIFQRPGSNALETAARVKDAMADARKDFPPGLDYTIVYNPTEFIQQSVDEVVQTLLEAILLVVGVV